MFSKRLRYIASAGLLGGALTVASLGGAFASPLGDSPTPTASPSVTATAPTSTTAVKLRPRARLRLSLLHGVLKNVSTLFGITPQTLAQQIEQGTSLAGLAPQYGKSAADVESTLTSALKSRLDTRVANGQLTSARETKILNRAGQRVDKLVNANLAPYVTRIEKRATRRAQANSTPTPYSQ